MSHILSLIKYHLINAYNFLARIFDNIPFIQKKYQRNINQSKLPLTSDNFNKLLFLLYKDRSGYVCNIDRQDPNLAKNKIFLTYGEILPAGLNRLFEFLEVNSDDSFVDLGSGAGKSVLQAFLTTDMLVCKGVEVDSARLQVSKDALRDLEQLMPNLLTTKALSIDLDIDKVGIEYLKLNIAEYDFNGITIVFMNSICFGENLIADIVAKVNAHENIRALCTTKSIEGLTHLIKQTKIPVETSWHVPPNMTNCYVYYR